MSNPTELVQPTRSHDSKEVSVTTANENVNFTATDLGNRINDQNLNNVNLTETIGGSETRKYLNQHVTPHLLSGMKIIAKEKPEDPLKFLGEYLIKQSDLMKNP